MSFKALGSDASRQTSRSNGLAPSSDNHSSHDHAAITSSRHSKHRHDAHAMEDLLRPSIVVKPHPAKLSTKPRCLQPLMLLPREHLPLSCLDLAAPSGEFEHARHYESSIKILDLESRMGHRPIVLLARMETSKVAYALERYDGNLYNLCRLGSWVDLEKLSSHATVAYSKLLRPRVPEAEAVCSEALVTPQLHKENKKRRLAMEAIQSLVKRPARSQSISLPSQASDLSLLSSLTAGPTSHEMETIHGPEKTAREHDSEAASANAAAVFAGEDITPQNNAEDIFENVRNQYFEALYHSMGSLAYFAKGPLSRARAAFHLDCDSTLEMHNLVDFLKGLVLTTIQIDKKYRESIPEVLAKAGCHIADSGDEQASKNKKRKTKKWKLGKDMLYPNEDGHVRKWWEARRPQSRQDDSGVEEKPQQTKLQISRLRSRETQLQMILILEILALELMGSSANAEEAQLPGLPKDSPAPDNAKELPKKRNKHNFPLLLDVHADRLSIWQSTSLDEIRIMDDSQSGGAVTMEKHGKSDTDPLKDFCIEIIVPFFSSRLPEHCDLLNRKLGGPVMPSPPKPTSRKSEVTAKPKVKPGSGIKRPPTFQPVRTLERVLSKETERNRRSISRGPGSVIALMRSATTPVPLLKRESSDAALLATLPRKEEVDDKSFHDKATSFGATRRLDPEEKAKREAEIKAELHDAISSLRKPNREVVVGKAMAEADERRATTSLSQLKKSRKPTEHPGIHNIVKATPAGPRFRNALTRESQSQPAIANIHDSIEGDSIPSSSRRIPSSVSRKRKNGPRSTVEESSPAVPTARAPSDLIDATPARPSLKRSFLSAPELDENMVLASSPIATRKLLNVHDASLRQRDSGIEMPSPSSRSLMETPVKKPRLGVFGSLEGFVTVTPVKKRAVEKIVATPTQPRLVEEKATNKEMSIVEKLGWDDDYDLQ